MSGRVVEFLQVLADDGVYTRAFIADTLQWPEAQFKVTLNYARGQCYIVRRAAGVRRKSCYEITEFGHARLERAALVAEIAVAAAARRAQANNAITMTVEGVA